MIFLFFARNARFLNTLQYLALYKINKRISLKMRRYPLWLPSRAHLAGRVINLEQELSKDLENFSTRDARVMRDHEMHLNEHKIPPSHRGLSVLYVVLSGYLNRILFAHRRWTPIYEFQYAVSAVLHFPNGIFLGFRNGGMVIMNILR